MDLSPANQTTGHALTGFMVLSWVANWLTPVAAILSVIATTLAIIWYALALYDWIEKRRAKEQCLPPSVQS